MILPATVAAMVELGANPGRGLDSLMSWWAVGCAVQRLPGRMTSPASSTSCAPAEPSCPIATVNSRRPPGRRRWNPLCAARVRVCLGTPDMSQSAIARRKAFGTATIQTGSSVTPIGSR